MHAFCNLSSKSPLTNICFPRASKCKKSALVGSTDRDCLVLLLGPAAAAAARLGPPVAVTLSAAVWRGGCQEARGTQEFAGSHGLG